MQQFVFAPLNFAFISYKPRANMYTIWAKEVRQWSSDILTQTN